jgi:hypothetical protein
MSELLSDDDLHRRLAMGRWKISLKSIGELRNTLAVSQEAASLVMILMQASQNPKQKLDKENGDDTPPKVALMDIEEIS